MDYLLAYRKQYYLLKQKVDLLSERDRALLLAVLLFFVFILWYFLLFSDQLDAHDAAEQEILKLQEQTTQIIQKTKTIENILSNTDTASMLNHYKQIMTDMKRLEQDLSQLKERYIDTKELSELLQDMLKRTPGVVIENFSTVEAVSIALPNGLTPGTSPSGVPLQPLPVQTAPPVAGQPAPPPQPVAVPVHYRLIMRGTYFSVMNYLKLLENLPWQLYWDKLDYTVTNYPEGLAIVDFYTLKPPVDDTVAMTGTQQ